MAKTRFESIDEYILAFPPEAREVLRATRRAIRMAVPGVEEAIGYQIPAWKYHGLIFYFAAYKHHYSLFVPRPAAIFAAFADELTSYEISKSTVKFRANRPVPLRLIGAMAKHRAAENLRGEADARKR